MDQQTPNTHAAAAVIGEGPQGPSPVEQARAELEIFRSGQNPELRARFLAGDHVARAQVALLHERAYPLTPDAQEQDIVRGNSVPLVSSSDVSELGGQAGSEPPCDPTGTPYGIFELRFDDDTPPEAMLEGQRLAAATAAAIGIDAQTAKGAISTVEAAIARRGGRSMDGVEMARLEHTLKTRWGAEYDQKMDRVDAAVKKAGDRGAAWLRHSLMIAGPETAAWAFETLANQKR